MTASSSELHEPADQRVAAMSDDELREYVFSDGSIVEFEEQ